MSQLGLHACMDTLSLYGVCQSGQACVVCLHVLFVQQQALVVQGFRSSAINVLIATSVGSEGMDFRQCQLVVAFDPPKVHRVMMRGGG